METGVYMLLGIVLLILMILTVVGIVEYFRLPKIIMDGPGMERVIKEEPDKPAPLTAGDDDWDSGFGESDTGKKYAKKAKRPNERLFRCIIILIILDVLFLGLIILLASGLLGTQYRKNEDLNDGYYEWYQVADCRINGDGVIYDEGGIKITVSGIYEVPGLDPEKDLWPAGTVKVGFVVENYSDKNVDIRVSCNSINGVATSTSYIYMMGNFKKNTTTRVYEQLFSFPGNEIGEMVFDDVVIFSLKYEMMAESRTPVFITTDAEPTVPEFDLSEYHPIFENDEFVICASKYRDQFHDGYRLYLENRSDMNYTVDIDAMTINGKPVTAEGIYDALIPAGNIMNTSQIYSYDPEFGMGLLDNKEVLLSLSIKCLGDEEENFSTGYMLLN